jgi:uncharacterized protein (TIGR03086 family)
MAQTSPNPIEVYEGASQMMLPIMAGVSDDQLASSTPCTQWTVQQLIQHNLKVSQWASGILTGGSDVNAMDVSGELPNEGAAAAFESITRSLLAAAKSMDLEQVLDTPFGPLTVGQMLLVPSGDIVVHKWDLAQATNQDTSLDSSLAEVCYQTILPMAAGGREAGFFAAEVNVPANATIQDKLLAVSGRQP